MSDLKKTGRKKNFKFKAELNQLLHLIVHSLYKHPEIFMRELISNASDALNKARFYELTKENILDPETELSIKINVNSKKKTFSIEDTGIGMTEEELVQNIGTVANSGTLNYIKRLQEDGEKVDGDLIGKFGVGFYSIFMVADEVTVETRSADPDSKGYRWISDGQGSFSIEEIKKKIRGTKISFKFKKEHEEFSEDFRVTSVLKKYSNFVDFPIYVNDKEENTVQALWRKNDSELKEEELTEFYKFVSMDYNNPLGHLHLSMEGKVNFKALLFVPEKAPMNLFNDTNEKGLHLYSNRVFIEDAASEELLPEYLRFIKGVVDTEDLPLNVSRETTQHSPVMSKIKDIVTKKVLAMFEKWAKDDTAKYDIFYENFGQLFKTGINTDFTNRDKIMKLLRFVSTENVNGELVSLDEYVGRMNEDQKDILYITGENRQIAERNPNLEYFRKNNIEVLFLTDPVDVFILPSLNEFDGKKLISIETSEIDISKNSDDSSEEKLNENALDSLITVFKETLGDKVKDVVESKRLVDSPATLVVDKDGMDPQMERMMRAMNQGQGPGMDQKKILEINSGHKLIKNLSTLNIANNNDIILKDSIFQLYESALLIDGNLKNPSEFIRRMTELMEKATGK